MTNASSRPRSSTTAVTTAEARGLTAAPVGAVTARFGLLASIGFMVFHAIGSVLNSMREMRSMLAGNPPNPWPGRILSWTISFLLVGWLSGGFQ